MKRLPAESANRALKVISGRYKLHILSHCMVESEAPVGAFSPGVAGHQKTLIHQLRELEAHGLVDRAMAPSTPHHILYRSTDLGRSLGPLIEGLCAWGRLHAAATRSEF